MEYCDLDFLGSSAEIDPNFKKLFEEVTGYKIRRKKGENAEKRVIIGANKNDNYSAFPQIDINENDI